MTEKVLVFDAEKLEKLKNLSGFSTDKENQQYFAISILPFTKFIDRKKAENDTQYKQIIPYVLVTHDNKVLVYKRTKQGGEGRLHEKYSVGIGGHINPEDGLGADAIANAISRELLEELFFDNLNNKDFNIEQLGFIYDDSNDVGKVHFGYVVQMKLNNEIKNLPVANENTLAELEWLTYKKAFKNNKLENWSKLVLKVLTNDN